MEYILRQHLAVGAEERVEPQAVGVVLSTEIALELQLADPEAEVEVVLERQLARPGAAAVVQVASAALAQKQVVLAVVVKLAGQVVLVAVA